MNAAQWKTKLAAGVLDAELTALYGSPDGQRERYASLLDHYVNRFGDEAVILASAPGRTELAGNHTDHQQGLVLCAGVTRDVLAAAAPAEDGLVTVLSLGFGEFSLRLDAWEPRDEEKGTSAGIVRGVAAALRRRGWAVGGFRAVVTSDVPAGGGLSSSAAFEILIGALLTRLYNGADADAMTLAKAGQTAERAYFGKPSGLLDQAACAVGGISWIDFYDPDSPAVTPIAFDFRRHGYVLCAVDTHSSHADLTADYAAIPRDMKAVAAFFGKTSLRYVNYSDFTDPAKRSALEAAVPPRAIARAEHFFAEDDRVTAMAAALERGDMAAYLRGMNESGRSSRERLGNVIPDSHPERTDMAAALDAAAELLEGKGAWRIHGGGFAGCIQCLVPEADYPAFRAAMDSRYGAGSCFELRVRPRGAVFPGGAGRENGHAQ